MKSGCNEKEIKDFRNRNSTCHNCAQAPKLQHSVSHLHNTEQVYELLKGLLTPSAAFLH